MGFTHVFAVVWGGAKGSTASAEVTSTPVDANTQGLDVSVKGAVAANSTLQPGTASVGKVVPEGSAGGVGTTTYYNSGLAATAVAVKASAGRVYGWDIYNPNAADAFVQVWNTAQGSVTVGTTAPLFSLWVPALAGREMFMEIPIAFSTAVTIAATTTATGGAGPTTGLNIGLWYV